MLDSKLANMSADNQQKNPGDQLRRANQDTAWRRLPRPARLIYSGSLFFTILVLINAVVKILTSWPAMGLGVAALTAVVWAAINEWVDSRR
jgi:hypothetical protein